VFTNKKISSSNKTEFIANNSLNFPHSLKEIEALISKSFHELKGTQ